VGPSVDVAASPSWSGARLYLLGSESPAGELLLAWVAPRTPIPFDVLYTAAGALPWAAAATGDSGVMIEGGGGDGGWDSGGGNRHSARRSMSTGLLSEGALLADPTAVAMCTTDGGEFACAQAGGLVVVAEAEALLMVRLARVHSCEMVL